MAVAPDSAPTNFFKMLFNYASGGVALAWPNNCKIGFDFLIFVENHWLNSKCREI
jgi:hypothetical protein